MANYILLMKLTPDGQHAIVADNDSAARYSIQLGVRVGVSITTLPAVPISLLHERDDPDIDSLITGREAPLQEPAGP